MSTYSWLRPVPALLVTGALTLSFAGGAAAGTLITGADVKDGSLQAKDLSAQARHSLRDLSGYEVVTVVKEQIPPYAYAEQLAECPAGTVPLSATGEWESGAFAPFQFVLQGNGYLARSLSPDSATQTMSVRIICADG